MEFETLNKTIHIEPRGQQEVAKGRGRPEVVKSSETPYGPKESSEL